MLVKTFLGKTSAELKIAVLALTAIAAYVVLKFILGISDQYSNIPLFLAYAFGGVFLVFELLGNIVRGKFGSDILAGISIVVALILGEYLAGVLVILMLSGGEALETLALRRASSVLEALAKRMPTLAHKQDGGSVVDLKIEEIGIGDELIVLPHEACPVDGVVIEGRGTMDESYLTGEPFQISKTPGAYVLSGAVNGDTKIVIKATRRADDSRFAKIMKVLEASGKNRPRLWRLGDQLGAIYTPIALLIAFSAWGFSASPDRFLAVLVVATPCPLLIAIPVALIGSISLAAKRSIIIRNPAALEQVDSCRTIILDKTGTLTYGRPSLTEQLVAPQFSPKAVLKLVASIEQYSKHPLSNAVIDAAKLEGQDLMSVDNVSEKPGQGLKAQVGADEIIITSRKVALSIDSPAEKLLPPIQAGLECVIVINRKYAATYRFRDTARKDSSFFINHLSTKHRFTKVMIVSGDRESEVRYLADQVGISEIHAEMSPEQKVEIVRAEMARAKTIFIGDGINDAPALVLATVGIAFGQQNEVTSEAADAVVMDSSLTRVDEFFHISRRMRTIALQSAIGGMLISTIGMGIAAFGFLTPVAGAITQEIIDLLSIINSLRVSFPKRKLSDF